MRARMAVAVSGTRVELREVVLRDKPPEMLEASPKGTVPVLIQPNGIVLDQSIDIMRWALAQSDPEGWLGYEGLDLVDANDGPFKHALDRYKYPHRYGLIDGREHRDVALSYLLQWNVRLGATPFLGGVNPAFADIALFPFVRQFAASDADWFAAQPLQALQIWLAALTDSTLFAKIMVRYPQWKTGDPPTIFS